LFSADIAAPFDILLALLASYFALFSSFIAAMFTIIDLPFFIYDTTYTGVLLLHYFF